ncbi:hypothetical protein NDU88_004877 [Pleurodeles waltl]|uniref:Uncharacterized protein n=1 Tax=Pleurodeles waltl TaxID=8319 RepID=A0AAV7SK71_PLEWA|nr:hypothetical protein NDU88_004877 [Pleurodeles waltl]
MKFETEEDAGLETEEASCRRTEEMSVESAVTERTREPEVSVEADSKQEDTDTARPLLQGYDTREQKL